MKPSKAVSVNVVIPNKHGVKVVTGIWCEPRWRRLLHWVFRIKAIALVNRVPSWREAWTGVIKPIPLRQHPMALTAKANELRKERSDENDV